MPEPKKGSDRNQIRKAFRKLSKRIGDREFPDRLNKRKPIFIKRNIYVTKKSKKRVKDHGIFCSCSSSPGSSTLCGSDCSCGILLSSCSSSCKCRSECTNKPFQQRHIKKMKLVQTEKCGYGIVADEDINPGEFVIEYVGEVIDEKICEERLWKLKRQETNFYLCQINWNMVIDATYKGNKSRYFNHSCSPNTEMQKWIIDGETRIGIFATRFINRGEQLTYDYQFVQYGADQECYCGAVCCRKKLGAKPGKANNTPSVKAVNLKACKRVAWKPPKGKKARGRRATGKLWNNRGQRKIGRRNCIGVVIWLARPMNRRCFCIIRKFDEFSRQHLVTYEDGVTEFINMSREIWKIIVNHYYSPMMEPDVSALLIGMSNVETLHLSSASADVISRCVNQGLILLVFNNLVNLSFGSYSERGSKLLLPHLLKQSPKLETLIIQGLDGGYTGDVVKSIRPSKVKVLHVLGFGGTAKEWEHVKRVL